MTPQQQAVGPLAFVQFGQRATGNEAYGWSGGGKTSPGIGPQISSVCRLNIDYSSDTSTASPKGPLAVTAPNTMAYAGDGFFWLLGWWL